MNDLLGSGLSGAVARLGGCFVHFVISPYSCDL